MRVQEQTMTTLTLNSNVEPVRNPSLVEPVYPVIRKNTLRLNQNSVQLAIKILSVQEKIISIGMSLVARNG